MLASTRKIRTLIICTIALAGIIAAGLAARSLLAPPTTEQSLLTETPCNLLQGCRASAGEQVIELQLITDQQNVDKTLHSQQPLRFLVHLSGIAADKVTLQLQGKSMYMGENHYSLKPTSSLPEKPNNNALQSRTQAEYDVTTILPVCTTGSMTWQAHIRVYGPSGGYQAVFEFDAS